MSYFNTEGPTGKGWCAIVFVLFLFLVGIISAFSMFEIIKPGERGVVINLGNVEDRILDEGIHLIKPFAEKVKIADVTVQKYLSNAGSASKDLQSVQSEIALNYHLDPTRVNKIYQDFRGTELESFIDPAIEESVKAATAKYNAESLITQREAVKEDMSVELKERLEPRGFLVDAVSIIDFTFSPSFDAAIEEKVTAEQEALAEENRLKQIEFQAQQRVVTAEAEARAIEIAAQAINSQGGADYVNLKAVEKWNGVLPTQMVPDGSLPFINLTK